MEGDAHEPRIDEHEVLPRGARVQRRRDAVEVRLPDLDPRQDEREVNDREERDRHRRGEAGARALQQWPRERVEARRGERQERQVVPGLGDEPAPDQEAHEHDHGRDERDPCVGHPLAIATRAGRASPGSREHDGPGDGG